MTDQDLHDRWHIPPLGHRIVKTTVAVFICLLIYYLRGYSGQSMPTESAITAIICMQPYVRDTKDYALNRFAGSLIGALWGLLFLLLLYAVPWLGTHAPILYGLMALGIMLSLYSAILISKPDTSSLAAIVFLCVVISFPDIEQPLLQACNRILDIFIGTVVAISVNVIRLPREKHPERVIFIRTKDLVPDRFSQIHPAVLFRLNYLYNDGAKICLMSEHAPAFFTLQMSAAKLSVPLIVMDGAAIYDANENTFLHLETIGAEDSSRLRMRLDALGISYFIYTVHRSKTCIFHCGNITEQEKVIYDRMRRSPYRSYLDGEIYEAAEIVYFKIIAEDHRIPHLVDELHDVLPEGRLRTAVRPQASAPGISGLYIYTASATMKQARKKLMEYLKQSDPSLQPVEILLTGGYRTERDAMHLMNAVSRNYEPIRLKRKQST